MVSALCLSWEDATALIAGRALIPHNSLAAEAKEPVTRRLGQVVHDCPRAAVFGDQAALIDAEAIGPRAVGKRLRRGAGV